MSGFRTLLWWLLLAAFGALAWDLLAPDLGEVVIRWHGTTVTTTVAFLLVAWGLLWFASWGLWTLLRLPFTAWQRMAQGQARNRLVNGLLALYEGRHTRASGLLVKASEDRELAAVGRLAAHHAARQRGDDAAAAEQQAALDTISPTLAALSSADQLLVHGQAEAALQVLQPFADRSQLPPRGQRLRAEALVAVGRAEEALPLLPELNRESDIAPEAMAHLERQWTIASLHQAAHANALHQRWQQLPTRLRDDESVVLAYARRAGPLGLEAQAAEALAECVERRWSEPLVREFALLPPAREDGRLARAESWLAEHPTSAALALALGRLLRRQRAFGRAEEWLHRALAQGADAEAWEELGHVCTAQDDAARAQACYANALRASRGEMTRPLGGRSLREQIADEAVGELRNEHGLPQLRE